LRENIVKIVYACCDLFPAIKYFMVPQPKRLELEKRNLVWRYIIIITLWKYYKMLKKSPSWIQSGRPKTF